MPLTHSDYRVAWICALPLEMAAAKAMLDEFHDPLPFPQAPSDPNAYTLGRLGNHNVVVACLPSGVYGTTSAATVLAHMLATFDSIQYGLMVGIGGGVPRPQVDIRLGDVVVSMPTATSGGVIQYDYGKTLHGGRSQHTGSLNKPPQSLLAVISQLRSDDLIQTAQPIEEIISAVFQKYPKLKGQFQRPDSDWLFNSTYDHQSNNNNTDASHSDCSGCDETQVVHRVFRVTDAPFIHYGLIASGNQVMKDAKARDDMAKKHPDILCFEMEAAGLMDQLPCLVIRGICDYCDSHKNKQWQGYAALVAAAYAKALLQKAPVHGKRHNTNDNLEKDKGSKGHWMVPFGRNDRFVGRQNEINQVESYFARPKKGSPTKVAIRGLGGIGKTQIALEIAYRMRERDPRCSIFWIPCTSNESVEQAYTSIAKRVGINDTSPKEVKPNVKRYFNEDSIGKWLLIFDNADDWDMWMPNNNSALPSLKDFLPQQNENGRILITTRNHKLAVRLASPQVISIAEPDKLTSIDMLRNSLIERYLLNDKNETVIDLLEKLSYLPLAIAQAAAYINENQIDIPTYIDLLEEQEEETIKILSEEFEDEGRYSTAHNPVATTWWISFQQIERSNKLAIHYLSFMACINPRDIPKSLLPKSFDSQLISKGARTDAIGILKAYSFLSEQASGSLFSLHRLVHLAARNWLRKIDRFNQFISTTADRFAEAFPNHDHTNRGLWREYLPHVLSLMNETEFKVRQEDYLDLFETVGNCMYRDGRYNESETLISYAMEIHQKNNSFEGLNALRCASTLACINRDQGQWQKAEELEVQVLETRKQVLGPKHSSTLTSMNNLASTYLGQGQWQKAEELGTQVLEAHKQVLGPKHPDTLTSMNNLALTYQKQGQWQKAEELGVQVLETHKQVLGPKHPDTLTSMNNLALTYQKQGQWQKAEELDMQVLETRKQVLDPKHPDTLTSMNNLALTYQGQGQWQKAEELGVQVLETHKQVLGPKHPYTLTSMGNLALTYQGQGQWQKAEELGVQVLETCKQVLGPKHPDTLISMGNLASTYQKQGQWQKAEELGVQALETCKQVLGPKHPNALISMGNLASTYLGQGQWQKAEELEMQVLETCKQVLGPKHPNALTSMSNLASTYRSQGQWQKAEELDMQVLETRKQVLDPKHPDILTSMNNLASTYLGQGQWQKAEELGLQVLETCKQVLGPKHPNALASMSNLAFTYRSQGQWQKAEELGLQVLETCKQVLGPKHPNTLTSMSNLASTYWMQDQWQKAEELGLQVLETRKQVLGPKHPDTLTSMSLLVSTYWMQDQWQKAEELGVQVLETCKQVLGSKHPDTLTSMSNLAYTLNSLGKSEAALKLIIECVQLRKERLGPNHPSTILSAKTLAKWQTIKVASEAEILGMFEDKNEKSLLPGETASSTIPSDMNHVDGGSADEISQIEETHGQLSIGHSTAKAALANHLTQSQGIEDASSSPTPAESLRHLESTRLKKVFYSMKDTTLRMRTSLSVNLRKNPPKPATSENP